MSKGIWTKHLAPRALEYEGEDRFYYFNAAQGRSLWHPPKDAIVHEASGAVATAPEKELAASAEAFADEFIASLEAKDDAAPSSSSHPNQDLSNTGNADVPASQPSFTSASPPFLSLAQIPTAEDIQDRIHSALNNSKEKLLGLSQSHAGGNKRFKNLSGSAIVASIVDEDLSEYEKQKSELENRQGSKGEGGKWLVR